ncbi:unnamed protein product [Heterosigma akashiwo]
MGHEAQRRMATSNVLICGLDGLGVEIAKNIILAGVKSVALMDPTPTSNMDLASQFYLSEQNIGTPRAQACVEKLQALNQYVPVSVTRLRATGKIGNASWGSELHVVVAVNMPIAQQIEMNDACRMNGACFVSGATQGVFARAFCDFGDAWVVSDATGEPPASFMVSAITQDNPGLVTTLEDQRHGLETGDVVEFSDVTGMAELNGRQAPPAPLPPLHLSLFSSGPTPFAPPPPLFGGEEEERGGYVNQVKQPVTLSFRPLRDALGAPGDFLESDFAKPGRAALLHQGMRAVDRFWQCIFSFPRVGAPAFHTLTRKKNGLFGVIQGLHDAERLLGQLAAGAAAVLCPVAAALGGVLGQEVLKACSGKFAPVRQFFYFDAQEALPEAWPLPAEETAPRGDRYDAQALVFGRGLQEKLQSLSLFLVGAGAIGCEMLKNWALMGVATGGGGGGGADGKKAAPAVHVTDMDRIEKSNLSRQFLFRAADIGQAKSGVSCRAAAAMNPAFAARPYELRVCGETEEVFNDDFYEGLDGVCTALDNVDARLYMDQKCLFYQLPMLESGTLGTKGNTQVVVPGLTENYGATRDPPEKSFPVCTLKNFPNQIEHTLQARPASPPRGHGRGLGKGALLWIWARDWFEGTFKQTAEDVNRYLSEPNFVEQLAAQPNTKLDTLARVRASLVGERPRGLDDCAVWARLQFEELFANTARQLLHNFPRDQVTSAGVPFWSGAKKPPTPLAFDPSDELHLGFVMSAANLRAAVYGIKGSRDAAYFQGVLPNVMVPEFVPRRGVKIAADEKEEKEEAVGAGGRGTGGGAGTAVISATDLEGQAKQIIEELPSPSELAGFRLVPVDFDKDLDDHMTLIAATSNLRARNYAIPEADLHRSRLIAGKIIPAISTTTALVAGLVCLELYKVVLRRRVREGGVFQGGKPLAAYKNGFANLALPLFAFSEPQPPAKTTGRLRGREWEWSAWDRIDVRLGDVTLKQFLDHFQDELGLEVTMLSHGVSILYSFFANKKKIKERMSMSMTEVVASVTKKPVPTAQKFLILEVICADLETSDEVEVPYVRFYLRD